MLRLSLALFALVLMSVATRAEAQMITYSPASGPALGRTVRGSSATTFTISTAGVVSRASGDAIRMSNTSVSAPTVNFSCGFLNLSQLCLTRTARVTIAPAGGTGPASITRFRISNLSGTTYRSGSAPAEAGVLVFDLNPLGLFGTVSFKLGMDVLLAAGAATGTATYSYTVSVEFV